MPESPTVLTASEDEAMEQAFAEWKETCRTAHATPPDPVDFRAGFKAAKRCADAAWFKAVLDLLESHIKAAFTNRPGSPIHDFLIAHGRLK